MFEERVVVRGGGDLGTGVAARLRRCGFFVAVLEIDTPMAVRRAVSFSEAVYDGEVRVEELRAIVTSVHELIQWDALDPRIPVVVDPKFHSLDAIRPFAVIDAIMAKRNTGTMPSMAPCVIGLGPGFVAGCDVDAVVETNRGPDLGRVIWKGEAEPNTGHPGLVQGRGAERVLRAPNPGRIRIIRDIGAIVEEGELIAEVGGISVTAAFRSVVRGIVRDGLTVTAGAKIGDIDPRLDPSLCYRISDKALAIAGGVLEAILAFRNGMNNE